MRINRIRSGSFWRSSAGHFHIIYEWSQCIQLKIDLLRRCIWCGLYRYMINILFDSFHIHPIPDLICTQDTVCIHYEIININQVYLYIKHYKWINKIRVNDNHIHTHNGGALEFIFLAYGICVWLFVDVHCAVYV